MNVSQNGNGQQTWKLTLAYDGSDFHGWQVQPGKPTVQGELQAALGRITGESPLPQGSGRTDAGVHALAQVASFSLSAPIPPANLLRALNRTLPPSIRITEARTVRNPTFHARHSALAKTYEYRVFREPACPPFLARFVYPCTWPIDFEALQEAALVFIGEHDFLSFAAFPSPRRISTKGSKGQRRRRRSRQPHEPSSPPFGRSVQPKPASFWFIPSAATDSCTTWFGTWWEPCSMWAAVISP
jgi:tRNA pseudouridine38-40 synthase